MNGDGMDDQPTADLETTLTAWGRAAVRTEEQSPRSYASATSQVPRPRRAILASAAAITALASTVAIWNSRETHSPPPAALTPAPCQQQFGTGRVDSEFQSLPPTITVALTYAGNGRCTIDAHAPHLELRDSKQRVLLEQDQSATYDLRRIKSSWGVSEPRPTSTPSTCSLRRRMQTTASRYLSNKRFPRCSLYRAAAKARSARYPTFDGALELPWLENGRPVRAWLWIRPASGSAVDWTTGSQASFDDCGADHLARVHHSEHGS
jgi:hypothetical protein